jgi:hypothetical protein
MDMPIRLCQFLSVQSANKALEIFKIQIKKLQFVSEQNDKSPKETKIKMDPDSRPRNY